MKVTMKGDPVVHLSTQTSAACWRKRVCDAEVLICLHRLASAP